ncbi:hypothetical protein LP7551_02834 [Roseibium album]|nr:hypothetical protein LP7551_02834 [Roseibium album]
MPWMEVSVMEERLRFVTRLLDGEGMSSVCRAFGISRHSTAHSITTRNVAKEFRPLSRVGDGEERERTGVCGPTSLCRYSWKLQGGELICGRGPQSLSLPSWISTHSGDPEGFVK